jgi:hypothetical protein
MLAFDGITAIETSAAGVIVKPVAPAIVPSVAVIVTDPCLSDEASPLEPDALLIVATVMSEELQVTAAVTSCVEASV